MNKYLWPIIAAMLVLTVGTARAERDMGTHQRNAIMKERVEYFKKHPIQQTHKSGKKVRHYRKTYSHKTKVGYMRPLTTRGASKIVGKTHGLNRALVSRLYAISAHYGGRTVHVTSGCRTPRTNRGVKNSYHLTRRGCKAADIRVDGVSASALYRHILRYGGGSGRYCGRSFVHTDVGPTRQWAWFCGKKRRR